MTRSFASRELQLRLLPSRQLLCFTYGFYAIVVALAFTVKGMPWYPLVLTAVCGGGAWYHWHRYWRRSSARAIVAVDFVRGQWRLRYRSGEFAWYRYSRNRRVGHCVLLQWPGIELCHLTSPFPGLAPSLLLAPDSVPPDQWRQLQLLLRE